jgi:hypothetical protein
MLPVPYRPRSWAPFKISPEVRRVLGVLFACIRTLYRMKPAPFIISACITIAVVVTLMGAHNPMDTVPTSKAAIFVIPQPERGPSFVGSESSYEGERVGEEPESSPQDVVPKLVDPIRNVRPAVKVLKANPDAFIKKWGPVAQRVGRKYGVPASIILAQAQLESNSGVSALAQLNNNYFGHKCFSKTCGRGHCSNYTDDTHKDFFVVYKSAMAAFEAHAKKISEGRYASLKKNGKNYRAWAKGLKAKGYATAGHYANSLIRTIENEGLARFDR